MEARGVNVLLNSLFISLGHRYIDIRLGLANLVQTRSDAFDFVILTFIALIIISYDHSRCLGISKNPSQLLLHFFLLRYFLNLLILQCLVVKTRPCLSIYNACVITSGTSINGAVMLGQISLIRAVSCIKTFQSTITLYCWTENIYGSVLFRD